MDKTEQSSGPVALAARAWFGLTTREQRVLMIVLALVLLGLAVKAWHVSYRARISDAGGGGHVTEVSE